MKKLDLTTGSAIKKVFALSVPMIISNMLHVVYNLADTAWLGVLGKEEVAAMAFVFPVVFFIVSIGIGLAIAASVLVSQHEGAGQTEEVNKVSGQAFSVSVVVALLVAILGLIFSEPIISLLGAKGSVRIFSVEYIKIMFYGVFFMFGFFIFNSLMRGYGNTKTPMKIMIVSNLVNIGLDPLLIFGYGIFPEMGVKGAALATIISRFGATIAGVYILAKGKHGIKISLRSLIPDLKIWKKIFILGWPATMENALRAFGMMLLTAIVAGYGTVYSAAYAVGLRVFSFFIMPTFAISMGVSAGVGQNLGAGLKKRALKLTNDMTWLTLAGIIVIASGLYMFSEGIAGVFIKSSEAETLSVAVAFLSRLAVTAPFLGIAFVMRGGFKGAGRTFQSMVMSIIGLLGIRVPIAYLLSTYVNGAQGIWDAFVIGTVIEAIISLIYYYKADWAIPVIDKPIDKAIPVVPPVAGV